MPDQHNHSQALEPRNPVIDVRPRSYPSESGAPDEPEQGGLLDYWRILRRRKGTVLLSAFFGLLIGVLVTLPQTPVYQARTSLEIQDINQSFLNVKEVSPVAGSGSYAALTDIQTRSEKRPVG